MTDSDHLLRCYRRLLRAYPRWYRRERGVEMMTTLLDAAAPGQRRPDRHDIVNLVGGGLRCRLRPPRGVGYRATAIVLALFAALAALGVAGLLSPPGPPTEAQAMTAATAAIPPRPHLVAGPTVLCDWCPDWDNGPLDRDGYVAFGYKPQPEEVAPLMVQARARLAAAGWSVDPDVTEDEDANSLHVEAHRGGTTISLTGQLGGAFIDKDLSRPDPSHVPVTLVVTRSFSATAAVTMVTGFLGGVLAGWLAATWTLHRFQRHRPAVRATILVTGLPVLLLAASFDIYLAQWAIGLTIFGNWSPSYLMGPAILAAAAPQLAAIAAIAALTAVAVAALPPRAGTQRATVSSAR